MLPADWSRFKKGETIALDIAAKDFLSKNAIDATGELNFAANRYAPDGTTIGMINFRYYPEQTLSSSEVKEMSASELKEIDTEIRESISHAAEKAGVPLLAWRGTLPRQVNSYYALVSEYRRKSPYGAMITRLVRVIDGAKSFTMTAAYREDKEAEMRPILDGIIASLRKGN